ncbi:MAG: polysaccharide deacetylase family protein [Tetrasphaera sp.]
MVLTRRVLLGGGVAGVLSGAIVTQAVARRPEHTTTMAARRRVDPHAVFQLHGSSRRLALTFDDGPDPDYTPAILAALAAAGVPATFFVIGSNAARYPELIEAIAQGGHHIGNHTQDHIWLDQLPRADVARQIRGADHTLGRLGVTPNPLFRPPHGWTSRTVADTASAQHKTAYYWTDCLEAHTSLGPAAAADAVVAQTRPGAIILCHDGGRVDGPNPQRVDRSRTVAALPRLIDGLQRTRFRFVTL